MGQKRAGEIWHNDEAPARWAQKKAPASRKGKRGAGVCPDYSAAMAPMGQEPSQAPQSMQAPASMTM